MFLVSTQVDRFYKFFLEAWDFLKNRKIKVMSKNKRKVIGNTFRHWLKIGSICEILNELEDGDLVVKGIDKVTGNVIQQVVARKDVEDIEDIEQ